MKIYSKGNFIAGLLGLGAMVLFGFKVIEANGGQWALAAGITVRCLYTALTESGSRRAKHHAAHYDGAAEALHGKHHALKTNLPWIVVIGFLAVGLVLKVLDVWMPAWLIVAFVLALTVSAFYSIGLQKEITDYIDEQIPQEDEPEP